MRTVHIGAPWQNCHFSHMDSSQSAEMQLKDPLMVPINVLKGPSPVLTHNRMVLQQCWKHPLAITALISP